LDGDIDLDFELRTVCRPLSDWSVPDPSEDGPVGIIDLQSQAGNKRGVDDVSNFDVDPLVWIKILKSFITFASGVVNITENVQGACLCEILLTRSIWEVVGLRVERQFSDLNLLVAVALLGDLEGELLGTIKSV